MGIRKNKKLVSPYRTLEEVLKPLLFFKKKIKLSMKLRGQLFIIPEPLVYWSNISDIDNYKGLYISKTEPMIRVQCVSPESLNWAESHPNIQGWTFPRYLPSNLFNKKTEGHKIHFFINNIKFKLTLTQTFFKYKHLGTFEEAFKLIIK